MSYPFRTTYKQDADTYVEDRGYAHVIARGHADFATLDAEFGKLLAVGQTARKGNDGEGWEVIEGFPMLDNARAEKLIALNEAWLVAEASGVVQSSVGFAIDANERANRDINGLITGMEATGQTSTIFCGADNSFHDVSLEDLKTMLLEIIQYGQRIYAVKWQIRIAIEQAKSMEELAAINVSFEGI